MVSLDPALHGTISPILSVTNPTAIGWWTPSGNGAAAATPDGMRQALYRLHDPVFVTSTGGDHFLENSGSAFLGQDPKPSADAIPLSAWAPPLPPEALGDIAFKRFHGLRYAYIVGAMANGITSVDMVAEAVNAGFLAFFGAAGLGVSEVDKAVHAIRHHVGDRTFGCNFIHSPNEPDLEMAVARLYIERRVRLVSASAFLNLSLPIVYYRVKGIYQLPDGTVVCRNKIKAKVSRAEVARRFFSPPPKKIIQQLLEQKLITEEEAALSEHVPMADDVTAEADSGGHTDNRPAITLLPSMIALKDQVCADYRYAQCPRVGLGGGIATPQSAAAAFAMGAAYVLVGSVHQSCVESGTSTAVRKVLCEAQQADVAMAPSADMFEMGVKVQVLKRGTMFALRAGKLYDLYQNHQRYDDIPADQRAILERDYFKSGFGEAWEKTRQFFKNRDPSQVVRAEKDLKHKMALVFRSYLGLSSSWATSGAPDRVLDYQIWCGPAMGAFNEWVRGSFLEKPENRKTVTIGMNLMIGAAVALRIQNLRAQGVRLPSTVERISPLSEGEIDRYLQG
jgi:trans-AT polyketide synthase, acyltransferase and oxidoreductase domains